MDGAARGGGGQAGRARHGLVPRPQPRHHHHLPRDTQGGDQQPRHRRHPVIDLTAGVHQGRGELRGPSPAGPQRQHPAPHQHARPGLEEGEVQSTH